MGCRGRLARGGLVQKTCVKGRLNAIFALGVVGSRRRPRTSASGTRSVRGGQRRHQTSKHCHSRTAQAARAGTLLMHTRCRTPLGMHKERN